MVLFSLHPSEGELLNHAQNPIGAMIFSMLRELYKMQG